MSPRSAPPPALISKPASELTRAEVIAALRRIARNGTLTTVEVRRAWPALYSAVRRLWGSFPRARRAAGLADPQPRRRWTRERVLAEIRALHRAGQEMTYTAMGAAGRYDLLAAAVGYLGSWSRARDLAGVPAPKRRRPQSRESRAPRGMIADKAVRAAGREKRPVRRLRPMMTRDEVLSLLRTMARAGTPLNIMHVQNRLKQRRLIRGAVGRFGSWDAAIAAAGLPPQRLNRAWTRDEVIAFLRRRHREGRSLATIDMRRDMRSFEEAARRLFGTYEAAFAAAGLTYTPLRVRRSSEVIVQELRALAGRRGVLRRRDVSSRLLGTIERRWGGFAAACVEAGVPYHLERRLWTREEVIRELRKAGRGRKMLRQRHVPSRVAGAARMLWGTWQDACAAAGFQAEPPRVTWSEKRLIAELRAAAAKRDRLRVRDLPWRVYSAASRRWGSWTAACAAAGVPHGRS